MNFFKISWRDIIGFAISAGLLWLTWQQSGLGKETIHFSTNAYIYLPAAMLAFLLSIAVHIFRAHQLWQGVGQSSPQKIATSLIIGNFFNVLLPGNLGEGIRAWHYHRKAKVSLWQSAAGIITEKFVDAQLYMITLLLLLIVWNQALNTPIFFILTLVGLAIFIVDSALLLILKRPLFEKKLWQLIPIKKLRQSLFRTYKHLWMHLKKLLTEKRLFIFSIMGYAIFSLNLVQYWCVLKATGIMASYTSIQIIFLIAMVMVVINVTPSAPGSAGVVHYGIFATLTLAADILHLPQLGATFALAGIYLHLSYFIPESIMGAYMLWHERNLLTQWKQQKTA